MAKRIFDLLFGICFLLLASPLMIALALLIFFASPGPILYQSPRLGMGGKVIQCLKFRTMYVDANERLKELLAKDPAQKKQWEKYQKLKMDPRITPLGKWLRITSLDELPQFWNVVRGDFSLVGPRPPSLYGHPERYLDELKRIYGKSTAQILSVKPGITGVWQVSGRSDISLKERAKMEAEYAKNRTLWMDLALLAKTVPAVFTLKGAR